MQSGFSLILGLVAFPKTFFLRDYGHLFTLILLNPGLSLFESMVDPDQLASEEADQDPHFSTMIENAYLQLE